MKVKRSFETKMGMWMVVGVIVIAGLIVAHWWQDSLGETGATVWSCHTMGNHRCGPHEPILRIGKVGD